MKYNNTVVLMWNPVISSVKLEDYAQWFDGLCTFKESIHNWSIYDYDKVGYGDRFLLVRVGDEQTGLVAAGMISSDCYEGADWAGSDRKRYYADLVPMIAFNQAGNAVYPTREQLQGAVPDFDWGGGHSGRVLTEAQACKLDEFLDDFTRWKKNNGNDPGKMRVRDYAASTGEIHPTKEDRKLIPNENPGLFIEAMIEQATGYPARDLEAKWKEHSNRWVRDQESLLQAAAWMAYSVRHKLPYYGALCLKIAHCYLACIIHRGI